MLEEIKRFKFQAFYRPEGKVMFSEASVSHLFPGGMMSLPVWLSSPMFSPEVYDPWGCGSRGYSLYGMWFGGGP